MTLAKIPFGGKELAVRFPDGSDILEMPAPRPLGDPAAAVREALAHPIGARALAEIAAARAGEARALGRPAKACVVVSDNTRPVPYREPNGVLMPILGTLARAGFAPKNICLLVATGTHRAMSKAELEAMLGPEPFEAGVEILNHDCRDESKLSHIGTTARGASVDINARYVDADLKILTGLVESHFMAGASGGRKAICPGIFGEKGTYIFHSAEFMAHPNARDLRIEGNPVHEESLEVAKMAGVDFIVNATIDGKYRMTGIFCGELEAAHAEAVKKLKSYAEIPIDRRYDLVVTHGGFVGLNHYQAAKAAVASLGALKKGGGLILVADNNDPKPVGSDRYRTVLSLLKLVGPEALERTLMSPDWEFIPEQWQVQEWAKVFKRISVKDFVYFAPQLDEKDWRDLPGVDGSVFLGPCASPAKSAEDVPRVVEGAIAAFLRSRGYTSGDIASGRCAIAYLSDGPYGIPALRGEAN